MSNNNVDRFTRMVQQGKITRAEAQRRREQSRLAAGSGPVTRPIGPPRVVNSTQRFAGVPSGYRRMQVWGNYEIVGGDGTNFGISTCPADPVVFPEVAELDHRLVEFNLEIIPSMYNPQLQRTVVVAGLWRFIPPEIVPPEDPEDPPGERSALPQNGMIRRYQGAQDMTLDPGGPLVKWTFRPRPGDRLDSLDGALPPLHLVTNVLPTRLRPPTGDPIPPGTPGPETFQYRYGAIYLVRDRQGFLL